ncbi:MAG: STT3 domain-containing protein [Candidatus Bathyarchaeia archaeon]
MKNRIANGLKMLVKVRPKINHASLIKISTLVIILFIAFSIRLFPLKWEIDPSTGKTSLLLSEFDPYFQYRFTEYIVKNGFISWAWPNQWVDYQRWYPYGINVAKAAFPGLPLTAAFLYQVISILGVNIDLMSFCAIFPAIMGMLASLAIYFLGKDLGGEPVGLLAALFLALHPSYVQRTSLGFFDDETVGILSMMVFAFLFLRAIDDHRDMGSSIKYSLAAGATLGYFCASWGAAYYPIGLVTIFTLALIIMNRYTRRLLLVYSITFGLGLFIAINIPKLSTGYLLTSAILPTTGVFGLLCLAEVVKNVPTKRDKAITVIVFATLLIGGFLTLWQLGYVRDIAGKFVSVINPFTREASPLIESVAEHRISAWGSIYYELGITIIFFMLGLFFAMRTFTNRSLFLILFGLTSLYFACSMVRLLVLLAPAFSLLAATGVNGLIKPFVTILKNPPKISVKKKFELKHVGREFSGIAVFLLFIILMTNVAFPSPKIYMQIIAPTTISGGSLSIVPEEPVQEWINMLKWMRDNLNATTVVCSWWDYGYWLTILGNVTSLADNATINSTQIENIGFIFMANETQALNMLRLYDAKYILVYITIDSNGNWANVGGDEGKWMWMASISGKARSRLIESGFISAEEMWTENLDEVRAIFGNYTLGKYWIDANKNGRLDSGDNIVDAPRGQNSTIYKLMMYATERWKQVHQGITPTTKLMYFKEAYIAGLENDGSKYKGAIPLVALYEINYPTG